MSTRSRPPCTGWRGGGVRRGRRRRLRPLGERRRLRLARRRRRAAAREGGADVAALGLAAAAAAVARPRRLARLRLLHPVPPVAHAVVGAPRQLLRDPRPPLPVLLDELEDQEVLLHRPHRHRDAVDGGRRPLWGLGRRRRLFVEEAAVEPLARRLALERGREPGNGRGLALRPDRLERVVADEVELVAQVEHLGRVRVGAPVRRRYIVERRKLEVVGPVVTHGGCRKNLREDRVATVGRCAQLCGKKLRVAWEGVCA